MAEDIASEIQNALTESWHQFLAYYNKLVSKYTNDLSKEDKETSHWICCFISGNYSIIFLAIKNVPRIRISKYTSRKMLISATLENIILKTD